MIAKKSRFPQHLLSGAAAVLYCNQSPRWTRKNMHPRIYVYTPHLVLSDYYLVCIAVFLPL